LLSSDPPKAHWWLNALTALKPLCTGTWAIIRSQFWPIAIALLVLYYIIAFVRPLAGPSELEADDVASSWNQSIARLGIIPVFPPQEDFYVGDVWAAIADADVAPKALRGQAVRLAHLDLRREVQKARTNQTIFASTAPSKPDPATKDSDERPASDEVPLTIAAFPGLTIAHAVRSSASAGWSIWRLGAARTDQQLEEIRIPVAETYGAPYVAALVRFEDWCADPKTSIYCEDSFVRRVLAYALSDQVLAARDGRYLVPLELRLVTSVFLTREIEQRRSTNGASDLVVQLPAEAGKSAGEPVAQSQDSKSVEVRTGASAKTVVQDVGPGAPNGAATGLSGFRGEGTEIEVHRSFQRPIVFGFRALSFSLRPGAQEQKTP